MLHDVEKKRMIQMAADARLRAYVPYSGFQVGACLKGESGAYYAGCNVENASFGASNCAERTAVFKAVSESEKRFTALAVVADGPETVTPCGICRQVLSEFCSPDMPVICANTRGGMVEFTLGGLLPEAFTNERM